jgi:hypothetical protein
MSFQAQGNTLKWRTLSPVQAAQAGEIEVAGVYANLQPGQVVTNQAVLDAGAFHLPLQAASTVPVVAPLITWPGSGETCTDTMQIRGAAQSGVTVTLYANSSPLTPTVADASGFFTTSYYYDGGSAVTLKAIACASNLKCSAESYPFMLTPPQSFWDPRRSVWEGTPTFGPMTGQHLSYNFRDNTGNFSTQNWVIPGVYGFYSTTLHLYLCTTVNTVTVMADGIPYSPPPPPGPGGYPPGPTDVGIPGGAHNVSIGCDGCYWQQFPNPGYILIDPDGYVFDVTKGLNLTTGISDSVSVSNTIKGVTVTAMVSMPQWGGWVPWPAQLYNNQVNPQVTRDNGYFAFFTPPGYYYLQAEGGANGYQSWRSPVVQVITQIIHVNVPLTPWTSWAPAAVKLTPNGPNPSVITVPVMGAAQWTAESLLPPSEIVSLSENPAFRLLSARNPLTDTLGFDGGKLKPGQIYRRQFTQPGTYTYDDEAGHIGTVIVVDHRVYLPVVLRH